jgi:hypothetical protein
MASSILVVAKAYETSLSVALERKPCVRAVIKQLHGTKQVLSEKLTVVQVVQVQIAFYRVLRLTAGITLL